MKRETRLNLIFLTLFLAITAPGAIILFKSKLDPSAAPMYLPDPVRQRLPYMAPQWTPEEVLRVIPELTAEWVNRLNREQSGHSEVLMHGHHPVMSEDRTLQVTVLDNGPEHTRIHLIAWNGVYTDLKENYQAALVSGEKSYPAKIRAAQRIELPDPVKRELMTAGYVKPRHWIYWIELECEPLQADKRPLVLKLSYKEGATMTTGVVNLFTE
jgi:hypothetical protein